jgi:branched-chain amino acid transport system permease protein
MGFFVALLIHGLLAGALYALLALAFVVVYKASRLLNFALGDCAMFAARLAAAGFHGLGLGLLGAFGVGCMGMVVLALSVNRLVLRPWSAPP